MMTFFLTAESSIFTKEIPLFGAEGKGKTSLKKLLSDRFYTASYIPALFIRFYHPTRHFTVFFSSVSCRPVLNPVCASRALYRKPPAMTYDFSKQDSRLYLRGSVPSQHR